MKTAKVIQSKLSRRYHSANSLSSGMSFKCLIAVLILLTFFIVRADNQPIDAESNDALFIDQKGNVGIGTNEPKAALDVNGKVRAHELEGDGSELTVGDETIKLFLVPKGGIIAWYPGEQYREKRPDGTMKIKAPDGWAICDGKNGTPDLQNRFIMGSGDAPDKTGGNAQHNHGGKVKESGASKRVAAIAGLVRASTHASPVDHNHELGPASNLPPYRTLIFIMKF